MIHLERHETMPLPAHLVRPIEVLMIDNFDSFTWNLYQSLCLLGAGVIVILNDAISPEDFPDLQIRSLVISPGPGHPQTDAGISQAAITYFMGSIPILSVCMGLECLVDVLGGEIVYVYVSCPPKLPKKFPDLDYRNRYAGEIMHGKVSRVRHDNKGCFKDIP